MYKSSLLEIIAKQTDSQNVFINNKALHEISFQSYVQHFSYLTQDSYLLPFSLADNISLGRNKKEYSVEELLHLLSLDNLIDKKDRIYNIESPELSGGELQRIKLGRALYDKKEWLFLDEAFSALDEKNALNIESFLLSDPELSVISISHKLIEDVVKQYDKVIEIKDKSV